MHFEMVLLNIVLLASSYPLGNITKQNDFKNYCRNENQFTKN